MPGELRLEHILRLAVALLVLSATMLLTMGEGSRGLLLVSVVLVALSVWVTDVRKWLQLNQTMASCIALVIMLTSAVNAYESDRAGQLIVVAHLQSYLQFVLLFQPKTSRVYWQLALLSLGQVAIASTLVPGPSFGIMLFTYVVLGIVTFSLLVLYTDAERWQSPAAMPAARALANGQIVLIGSAVAPRTLELVRGLLVLALGIAVCAVITASAIFFVLPRWHVPNRELSVGTPLRSVGFSKKVTLGELGEVVNSSDLVMRVQFFRDRGNEAVQLQGEPLFRGNVVTRYVDGEWSHNALSSVGVLPSATTANYMRQRITAEPLDVSELFPIYPVFAVGSEPRLRIDGACERLVRQEEYRDKQFDFEVGTTGIVDGRQRDILPHFVPLRRYQRDELLGMPRISENGQDPLEGLRTLAAQTLAASGVDPQEHLPAARALNRFFRESGQFSYSLEAQQRDSAVDPIEDFVTRNKRGHCEYFAGALVMMLRSQGIPARMALGFKGGEWNTVGKYYQVQQLHAHAWVEAYLTRGEIPEGEFAPDDMPQGAWLVLDPTAGARETTTTVEAISLLGRVRQYIDYMQVLWTNYVASLNPKRQNQTFYEPLAVGTTKVVDSLVSVDAWRNRWQALGRSQLGTFWEWYRRHWFSWRGGLVAALFSLAAVAAYHGARWGVRTLRRLGWVGAGGADEQTPALEMYRRLESALMRHGLSRQPQQTAYEFAVIAGGELAEQIEYRRVAHLPRRIVEVFHRVRFGGRTLDNSEAEAVEHALCELELALSPARR